VTKDFGTEECEVDEEERGGVGEKEMGDGREGNEENGTGSKVDVVEKTKWQWVMSRRAKWV
jgi:hypothetical protein